MVKPYRFDLLPYRARPTPRLMDRFLDRTKCGYLSPEVQIRNLRLFGFITSEKAYREEHALYMLGRRLQANNKSSSGTSDTTTVTTNTIGASA